MNEQLQESTDKVTDLEAILEATQLRLQQSQESHQSYRLKAQKILSEKEAFIKSMTDMLTILLPYIYVETFFSLYSLPIIGIIPSASASRSFQSRKKSSGKGLCSSITVELLIE